MHSKTEDIKEWCSNSCQIIELLEEKRKKYTIFLLWLLFKIFFNHFYNDERAVLWKSCFGEISSFYVGLYYSCITLKILLCWKMALLTVQCQCSTQCSNNCSFNHTLAVKCCIWTHQLLQWPTILIQTKQCGCQMKGYKSASFYLSGFTVAREKYRPRAYEDL